MSLLHYTPLLSPLILYFTVMYFLLCVKRKNKEHLIRNIQIYAHAPRKETAYYPWKLEPVLPDCNILSKSP